mmetsp:Transcript_19305/g.24558  ORF Transcript_19305/g.24558 Transcript_19305/m.24558 type:complete len:653 (+) Transcript_19305:3-1961(+)
MKTAQRLGIQTVAIYSEPDAKSVHVKMADEAYCVGPAASAKSYLNIPRIMEVIKESGAQAVHPGYGFLSENYLFAEELEKNNVAFIGPGSYAITAMGDKIESKEVAKKAGVNVIPGDLTVLKTEEEILAVANKVGYPVMIKASAGGGGKGMRIAWNDEEAKTGFRLSTEEAKASFGDDRVFVEKYIEEPRHIEIQLIADSHGNVCALPERECSIQRRNQKVLEEAPSVLLDPETRRAMQDQACALASAVNYKSAGTVEFLCDKHKNFYFLEMNTRLQVEHPVTELVTGVDLVEQMIRVAAGYKLPDNYLQGPLPFKGWAHEARVYAEDPVRGFLPSTGRLISYQEPSVEEVPSVRCDSGITQGSEISMFYDPMISKLCTYRETREEALDDLGIALDSYIIHGVRHNISFLRDCIRAERFRSGKITTNYIAEEYPDGFTGVKLNSDETQVLAAITATAIAQRQEQVSQISGQVEEPVLPEKIFCKIGEKVYAVEADEEGLRVSDAESNEVLKTVTFEDFDWTVDTVKIDANIDGTQHVVQIIDRTPAGYKMQYLGAIEDIQIFTSDKEYEYSKYMLPKPEIDSSKWLLSPMPGALISVAVEVGQEVYPGQELAVVEAMKMQNVLAAEKKGVVKAILENPGATLAVDQEILEFE